MFEFINKEVIVKFVIISGKEVVASDISNILEEFVDADYINEYTLHNNYAVGILVNEGILQKYIGSRMATLYKKTAKFEQFYQSFREEYTT